MALTTPLRYGIGILCAVCIIIVIVLRVHTTPPMHITSLPQETISIGTTTLTVEIASTPQERQQGLSGRTGFLPDTGMLFVFDAPGEYGFWMKDMRFSLDMLFVDANKSIVTIDQNIAPNTYPQTFYASKPIVYVIELPAGFSAAHGIVPGQKVVLP